MRLTRLATAAAAVATVAASALVVTAPAEAAQKTVISSFYHSNPIKSEQFQVRGTLSTRLARHVVLQLKSGSSWKNVVTDAKSDDTGAFAITTTTSKTSTYRVVAPVTSINGKSWQRLQTGSKTVKLAGQSSTISVTPKTEKVGSKGSLQVVFSPVRAGRPVTIYIAEHGHISASSGYKESATGRVSLPLTPQSSDAGTVYIWAHADSLHGAAGITTKRATLVVTK